jgi:hypothetical protein
LHPLPKATRSIVVEAEDVAAVAGVLLASQLQPSALDVLHPGRLAALFEGSERAVQAQVATAQKLDGSSETDARVWDESRQRQADAQGRLRFAPGELAATLERLDDAIVRPASGVAYVPEVVAEELDTSATHLFDAIRGQLDPQGVLAA